MAEVKETLSDEQRLPFEFEEHTSDGDILENLLDDMDSLLEDEEPTSPDEPTDDEDPDEEADEEGVEDEADEAEAEDGDDQPDEDADEEGEDGEDDEEDADEETYHPVKIDGEDFEVTLQEALDGYSRTQDYTRKRQANEEEHRASMAEVQQQSSEYVAKLDHLEEVIRKVAPPERTSAEWTELQRSDPVRFASEFADAQLLKQKTDEIAAERQREIDAQVEIQSEQYREYLSGQRDALLEAIPEWKDDKVSAKERSDLKAFALEEFGYTEEDLGMVADHRLMLILRDSMMLRRSQKKGKEKIREKKKGAKRLRPGKTKTRNTGIRKSKALRAAEKRLVRSGSEQDALAVLEEMDL